MSNEYFQIIMQHSGLLSLNKNELLFKDSNEVKHFYMIHIGQMISFHTSPDGKEKVIDIHESGQFFYESSLFSEENCYPFEAKAVIYTQLFYFDAQTIRNQLRQSTQLCFSMMAELNRHLMIKKDEVIELSIYNAQHRIVKYLLRKSCKRYHNNCKPIVILSMTKALLASYLSTTPETFSRILAKLKKQGLISIENEVITLIEPQKLRELIGCDENKLLEKETIQDIKIIA